MRKKGRTGRAVLCAAVIATVVALFARPAGADLFRDGDARKRAAANEKLLELHAKRIEALELAWQKCQEQQNAASVASAARKKFAAPPAPAAASGVCDPEKIQKQIDEVRKENEEKLEKLRKLLRRLSRDMESGWQRNDKKLAELATTVATINKRIRLLDGIDSKLKEILFREKNARETLETLRIDLQTAVSRFEGYSERIDKIAGELEALKKRVVAVEKTVAEVKKEVRKKQDQAHLAVAGQGKWLYTKADAKGYGYGVRLDLEIPYRERWHAFLGFATGYEFKAWGISPHAHLEYGGVFRVRFGVEVDLNTGRKDGLTVCMPAIPVGFSVGSRVARVYVEAGPAVRFVQDNVQFGALVQGGLQFFLF